MKAFLHVRSSVPREVLTDSRYGDQDLTDRSSCQSPNELGVDLLVQCAAFRQPRRSRLVQPSQDVTDNISPGQFTALFL